MFYNTKVKIILSQDIATMKNSKLYCVEGHRHMEAQNEACTNKSFICGLQRKIVVALHIKSC